MPSSPEVTAAARPRATIVGAFLEGWRRVLRAPALSASVLAATALLALPLAFALQGMLEQHLGTSLEADRAVAGWNAGWAAEFGAQAQGIGRTFSHEILGFGGTMAILSGFIDHEELNPTIAGAVTAYVVVWIFLSGGLIDRLARGRPIRTRAFFGACGEFFVRFLRLGLVIGIAYWVLFSWLHPLLFSDLYNALTQDMTEERLAVALRAALYAVFLAALALVSLVADFAKVRAVVEDRRSMLSALGASVRFIRRRFIRVAGLYLLNVAALFVILRLWLQLAPAADTPNWLALLLAQVYLLFRVWAKLAFMASEAVFFQGELAHAGYTAGPRPLWPDSAAVEAIENLSRSS